jgi:hypothetical protein
MEVPTLWENTQKSSLQIAVVDLHELYKNSGEIALRTFDLIEI